MKRRRSPRNPVKDSRLRAKIAEAQDDIAVWEKAVMVEQLPIEMQVHVHQMAAGIGLPAGSVFAAYKVFRLVLMRMKVDHLTAQLPHVVN